MNQVQRGILAFAGVVMALVTYDTINVGYVMPEPHKWRATAQFLATVILFYFAARKAKGWSDDI